MRSGDALTDDDRWPWLDRIGAGFAEGLDARPIVACSALQPAYRDRLRPPAGPALRFVYLAADREAMRSARRGRKDHYMPASLVDRQFAALEPPRDDPGVIEVSAERQARRHDPLLVARLDRPAPRGTLTWSILLRFLSPSSASASWAAQSRRDCSKPPRP